MNSSAPARRPGGLTMVAGLAGMLAVVGLSYLFFSVQPQARLPASEPALASPPELGPCVMDREGYISGQFFGAVNADLDWTGAALACDGHARPADRGLRLFFAGTLGDRTDRLVLVLGIAAGIDELVGGEHDVNLTIIDEAADRFYNSGKDRCWTRVFDVVALEPTAGEAYRVDGELYCAGAIPSLTDAASITPGIVSFSGRLTLGGD